MSDTTGSGAPPGATRRQRLLDMAPVTRPVTINERHTRFVGLMRWALAFGAIALATALVVWPYFSGRNTELPPIMPEEILRNVEEAGDAHGMDGRPSMTNARFLASDKEGQPYTVTAALAWHEPGDEELIFMETVSGDILLKSGAWMALSADRGVFDQAEQLLILERNVDLFSDSGYEVHTDYAEIDLASGTAEGDMQVEGQGPAGLLSAAGFRITDNGDRIRFTGPVRMTIYPGTRP